MRPITGAGRTVPIAAVALLLSACNANSGFSSTPGVPVVNPAHLEAPPAQIHRRPSSKIQHIVIIVQENRSFNNLFMRFPGAKTRRYGYDTSGNKIKLQPVGLETTRKFVPISSKYDANYFKHQPIDNRVPDSE